MYIYIYILYIIYINILIYTGLGKITLEKSTPKNPSRKKSTRKKYLEICNKITLLFLK